MPLGEKIEKPDDEPEMGRSVIYVYQHVELLEGLPMYRVSPQLFVTREHIMSDRPSTSVSDSFCDSGDVAAVRGLD